VTLRSRLCGPLAEGIVTSHKERHQPKLRLPELQPSVTNKASAKLINFVSDKKKFEHGQQ
jgi:hypothetical protein